MPGGCRGTCLSLSLRSKPPGAGTCLPIAPAARRRNDCFGRLGPKDHVVALDVKGVAWSTEILAKKLDNWRMDGQDLALLVGGADGLDELCLQRADDVLSLSALTFPHALVRVVVAEQIYRAWTLLAGHPYHRA